MAERLNLRLGEAFVQCLPLGSAWVYPELDRESEAEFVEQTESRQKPETTQPAVSERPTGSLRLEESQVIGSLISSARQVCIDKKFASRNKVNGDFQNYYFQRLVAKEVRFEQVNFSYSIFDTCYLRKCVFDNCNFTGCRFTGSNLYGSHFSGCKFEYSTFERTTVDPEILDVGCPGSENLRLRFARTLRTNFQALGDAAAVNKAINVELEATREHFWKGWSARESYYRGKYRAWSRVKMFFGWFNFKLGDYLWGNGESFWKLGRTFLAIVVAMAVAHVFLTGKDHVLLTSYLKSVSEVPPIFFGLKAPSNYPDLYLVAVLFLRLVLVGFFLSIVIKRFSRR